MSYWNICELLEVFLLMMPGNKYIFSSLSNLALKLIRTIKV